MPFLPLLLLLSAPRVITLAEALDTAHQRQPDVRRAHADTQAAQARADQTLAPFLPQLGGTASYQRTTANFVARPGFVPMGANVGSQSSSFDTFNYFNFGVNADQLVWDFGNTWDRHKASLELAKASEQSERSTRLQVGLNVRTTYFDARAGKALVRVAQETLDNQEKHLAQVKAFVEAGTRPEIDLAQVRTDVANARVQLINAENGYASAKARLMQAMGVEGVPDFDVADESMPPVEGEEQPAQSLLDRALAARPELAALENQVRAQELTLDSIQGAYWPRLGLTSGFSDGGTSFNSLAWNLDTGVTLSWSFFEGGLTRAQADEARAQIASIEAQVASLRLSVQVEVEQARLAVLAAKAVVSAAAEAADNARERLRLAEGRYETGVGSSIRAQ